MRSESQLVEDPGWRLNAQIQHPPDSLATRGNSEVDKKRLIVHDKVSLRTPAYDHSLTRIFPEGVSD